MVKMSRRPAVYVRVLRIRAINTGVYVVEYRYSNQASHNPPSASSWGGVDELAALKAFKEYMRQTNIEVRL